MKPISFHALDLHRHWTVWVWYCGFNHGFFILSLDLCYQNDCQDKYLAMFEMEYQHTANCALLIMHSRKLVCHCCTTSSNSKGIGKIMTFQAGFTNTTCSLVRQPDSPALNSRHWLIQYCCVRMLKQSNVLIPLQCFTVLSDGDCQYPYLVQIDGIENYIY